MNTGLSSHVFPRLPGGGLSGAGDEEVFETKACPQAVAGPLNLLSHGEPAVKYSTTSRGFRIAPACRQGSGAAP